MNNYWRTLEMIGVLVRGSTGQSQRRRPAAWQVNERDGTGRCWAVTPAGSARRSC